MKPEFFPDEANPGFFMSPNWPIMKLHTEGDFVCDRNWVNEAFRNHQYLKEQEDYLPGVIIGHTGKGEDEKPNRCFFDSPRLVGDMVHVDLVHIPANLKAEIEEGRWPNRSVELLPRSKRIDRLALLGGTTPYFALPQARGSSEKSLWYSYQGERRMAKDKETRSSTDPTLTSPESVADQDAAKNQPPSGEFTPDQLKVIRQMIAETVVEVLEEASDAAGEAAKEPPSTVTTDNPAGKGYSSGEVKELREQNEFLTKAVNALTVKVTGSEHRDYLKGLRHVGHPVGDDGRVEERVKYMLTLDDKQLREYKRTLEELPKVPTEEVVVGDGPRSSDRTGSGDTRHRSTIDDTKRYYKENEARLKGLGITEEELILAEHAFGGR